MKSKKGTSTQSQKKNDQGLGIIQSVRWRVASCDETKRIDQALDRLLAEWVRQVQASGGQKHDQR